MKVVVNKCFGGFSLAKAVFDELGLEWDGFGYLKNEDFDIKCGEYPAYRSHPPLIDAIEKVGIKESAGDLAELEIVDIPDDIKWGISDYDGVETVHEKHRTW